MLRNDTPLQGQQLGFHRVLGRLQRAERMAAGPCGLQIKGAPPRPRCAAADAAGRQALQARTLCHIELLREEPPQLPKDSRAGNNIHLCLPPAM